PMTASPAFPGPMPLRSAGKASTFKLTPHNGHSKKSSVLKCETERGVLQAVQAMGSIVLRPDHPGIADAIVQSPLLGIEGSHDVADCEGHAAQQGRPVPADKIRLVGYGDRVAQQSQKEAALPEAARDHEEHADS